MPLSLFIGVAKRYFSFFKYSGVLTIWMYIESAESTTMMIVVERNPAELTGRKKYIGNKKPLKEILAELAKVLTAITKS